MYVKQFDAPISLLEKKTLSCLAHEIANPSTHPPTVYPMQWTHGLERSMPSSCFFSSVDQDLLQGSTHPRVLLRLYITLEQGSRFSTANRVSYPNPFIKCRGYKLVTIRRNYHKDTKPLSLESWKTTILQPMLQKSARPELSMSHAVMV
jgi:hypothetical protein